MTIPFIAQLPEAPQRTDARPNFALRADIFFSAIDPMRYQMNQMAAWMNDQRDDIYSYSDEVEAIRDETALLGATAKAEADRANDEADRAQSAADKSEEYRDDTAALIAAFDPTGDDLPPPTIENAPLVIATPQGGVKFSRRALNNGIGVRPALRFDFANQGYLDPRITLTRATPDWDWDGKRYEANEPVLSDEGLRLWGSRTNLCRFSNGFNEANWNKTYANATLEGDLKSPYGNSAFRVSWISDRSNLGSGVQYNLGHFDVGAPITSTILVKAGTSNRILFGSYRTGSPEMAVFDLSSGSVASKGGLVTEAEIVSLEGGWFLLRVTYHVGFDGEQYLSVSMLDGGPDQFFYVSSAQAEEGLIRTPYIPTNGSQVTVAASTLEVLSDSFSSKLNPFEGTIVWRVGRNNYSSAANTPPHANMGIVGGGSNNGLLAISGNSLVYHDSNGDYQESLAVPAQPFSNDEFTIAYTYTKTGVSVSHNGELTSAEWDASEFLENAVNRLYVSGLTNGYVRALSYYDRALTDEQLQELTS